MKTMTPGGPSSMFGAHCDMHCGVETPFPLLLRPRCCNRECLLHHCILLKLQLTEAFTSTSCSKTLHVSNPQSRSFNQALYSSLCFRYNPATNVNVIHLLRGVRRRRGGRRALRRGDAQEVGQPPRQAAPRDVARRVRPLRQRPAAPRQRPAPLRPVTTHRDRG